MQRLSFESPQLLDRLLGSLRVQSTIFCRSELRAPWGFAVRPRDAAAFHVVLSGSCYLELDGDHGQVPLATGDLVVLPKGSGHVVRDEPESAVRWLDDLLRAAPFDGRLRHGGDGPETVLLCGGFTVGGQEANPVLALLPEIVHVESSASWLAPTVALVRGELGGPTPGSGAIVARLADVLLVQAVRSRVQSEQPERLRALEDREIAHALALVHERPENPWTVTALASAVALSRSAFAERFRRVVGEPPMRYVRRCRMTRAAELLRATNESLAVIAERSGYESEVSLSRAFKRTFAVSPGRYRTDGAG